MNLKTLISSMTSTDAAQRQAAVRIAGLVDEVGVLPTLRQQYTVETDPQVKQAMDWAGKRLFAAQKAGYSTLNEIFREFRIDAEIENMEDETEAKLMRQMEAGLQTDLMKMRSETASKTAIMGAAAGLVLGGALGAMSGATMGMSAGVDILSSGMENRPTLGKQRIVARVPTNTNAEVWLRRLQNDPNSVNREKVLREILELNNPSVLPTLATLYFTEVVENVQVAIQKTAKTLYLGVAYWELTQDGTIEQEVKRRIAAVGKAGRGQAAASSTSTQEAKKATSETSAEELARILQRGREARDKRQNKR